MARGRSPSQRSDHRGPDRPRVRNPSRSRSREGVATNHRPRREPDHGRRDRSPVSRKELFPNHRPSSKDKSQPRGLDKDSSRAKSPGNSHREKSSRNPSELNQNRPKSPIGNVRGRGEEDLKKSEKDQSTPSSSKILNDSTSGRRGEPRPIKNSQPASEESSQPRKRRRSPSPQPSREFHKARGRSPVPRRPASPPTERSGEQYLHSQSQAWSQERRYWSPRREAEFDVAPHHREYRGRSPIPRGPSSHHEGSIRWQGQPQHPSRREISVSPRRDPRRRSPHRFGPPRRSRSRSTHSRGSRPTRSRGGSPDMYSNPYGSRGRYPPGPRGYSKSPPHPHPHPHHGQGHPGEYRGGWSSHGPGSPNHGYESHSSHPPHPNAYPPQSPYQQGPSYGSSHSHNTGYPNSSHRERGGGLAPSNPASSSGSRSHFQNLSWTPDKGIRGGVAPSERLSSLQTQDQRDGDPESNNADYNISDSEMQIDPKKSNSKNTPLNKSEEKFSGKSQNPKNPPTGPASSKTSIKFEMKIQSQPALAKKPNVIQSALKAPPKPTQQRQSVFNEAPRRSEPLHLRTQPPSGPRRDDRRHGPPTRDSRGPPPRSPVNMKNRSGPENWGRNRHEVPLQTNTKVSKRRKKIIKVTRTHRKVVLPPRKLSEEWARSEFVYYPKPDQQSVVGAGTYGKVFKAHNVYLSKVVALKTLPLIKMRRKLGAREYISRDKKRRRVDRLVRDGLHLTSLREIKLLKSISHLHQNIVGIREIFLESESCNLVFDYFEFDMHGIIYSSMVTLQDSMLKDLVRQVFQGLEFLHTKANILHRDIKAANILVSTKGQVRITDFGLAKNVKTQAELDAEPWYKKKFENSNRVITTPYRPPELILGATLYGGEVDVWSAGCVLFEAFLRKLPFQGNGEDVDHLLTIWKILGLPNTKTYPEVLDLEWYWLISSRVKPKMSIFAQLYKDKVSPHLYHLLRCIFQHDPRKRPTATQVLSHPFFTSEEPFSQSAGAILETVEGEWHELEYKMMRDKEKAEARRKHEDSVIICFLKMKQEEHERKFQEATEDADAESAARRVDFYKAERDEYQQRMDTRVNEQDEEEDHAKQVAAIKKSHGDMYMDASRRSRYRGPVRDKVDEKLLGEAWKWYDDEKRKGNDPVPMPSLVSKIRKPEKQMAVSIDSGMEQRQLSSTPSGTQSDYERKFADYERRLAAYQKRKSKSQVARSAEPLIEKRVAMSPLVDDRDYKKLKDDASPI